MTRSAECKVIVYHAFKDFNSPKEAAHDMLKETSGLLLHQLGDHVAEDRTDGVKPLVGSADIIETIVIQQNLLYNEYGHGLAQFGAGFHDSETKRNDLCSQEKIDNFGGVVLNQSTNDSEACKTKIFEGSRFRGGVEEGIQV